eukprot:CAMPEP_0184871330 /NCGR_PEP_ID=MMETSP0580-20130426/40655_1 /TAXON_ID=1118495 /ORGANISM="Dactyliosolen fragilissimus" /LENGTH=558 /DNA_ID=CAMNT_0027373973 /DNA_START=121 /DNA_END=1797 /DNA_ORIENTATION=-
MTEEFKNEEDSLSQTKQKKIKTESLNPGSEKYGDNNMNEFDSTDEIDADATTNLSTEAASRARIVSVTPPPPSSQSSKLSSNLGPVFSPELLAMYYSRLFPYNFMHSWLSYDPSPENIHPRSSSSSSEKGDDSPRRIRSAQEGRSNLFKRREFSFTIEPQPGDEIYIRYQSFSTQEEFRTAVLKRRPTKIDIGAIFSHPPKDHLSIQKNGSSSRTFVPEQRELVFDVDLTDYDGVRKCGCSGAAICGKCWKMMNMAIRVMDAGLREDFGFQNIVWFYSGRRGVHAWVSDEVARKLTDEGRSAVASYFEVNLGSEHNKVDTLPYPLHPTLARSHTILEPMFIADILPSTGHGLLANAQAWEGLLASLPDAATPVADTLLARWNNKNCSSSPAEKWNEIKRFLSIFCGKGSNSSSDKSMKKSKKLSNLDQLKIELWPIITVFTYTYPRLDINVSKMRNHLLKSPFCVHPKTGRVCVPINIDALEDFDPEKVPTLNILNNELDQFDKDRSKETSVDFEWQKTSLKESFEYFQNKYLTPVLKDLKRKEREEFEKSAAVVGDF